MVCRRGGGESEEKEKEGWISLALVAITDCAVVGGGVAKNRIINLWSGTRDINSSS
jgi:hypothetical protein